MSAFASRIGALPAIAALAMGLWSVRERHLARADAPSESDDNATAAPVGPDLRPNSDWKEVALPELNKVEGRSFGEPAAGCYASVMRRKAGKKAGLMPFTEAFAKGLPDAVKVTAPKLASDATVLELSGAYSGKVALWLGDSDRRYAYVLSCYWNQREAALCRSACTQILQQHQGQSF